MLEDSAGVLALAEPETLSVSHTHLSPKTRPADLGQNRLDRMCLIENASGIISRLPENSLVEAFPIKSQRPPGSYLQKLR